MSSLPADRESAIDQAARGPASVSSDGATVEQQAIPDIIEADRYLAGKAAGSRRAKLPGIRVQRLRPEGGAS